MLGVVELDEAKRRAYDSGLDLVEISPDSRPPVCKIMDFGKFKYEQSKKEKANKAKSKASEMKEVRLGRSMKIDPHDVGIRVAQARRFLIEGHRVQIIQNFRGREMAFRSKGDDRMYDIIQRLSDLAKVEVPPRLNGRRMGMILVPEKQKIEAYKKKMVAEGKPILPTIPEQLAGFAHEDDDDDDDDLDGMDDGHDGGHEDMHEEMHGEAHGEVHAEMHAILGASRVAGDRVVGGKIFVTTYPCHSCARHIVAAGISEVYYIEPYRKSLATRLHSDALTEAVDETGRVKLMQFDGVAPRRFIDLFDSGSRKSKAGVLDLKQREDALPSTHVSLRAIPRLEEVVVAEISSKLLRLPELTSVGGINDQDTPTAA